MYNVHLTCPVVPFSKPTTIIVLLCRAKHRPDNEQITHHNKPRGRIYKSQRRKKLVKEPCKEMLVTKLESTTRSLQTVRLFKPGKQVSSARVQHLWNMI